MDNLKQKIDAEIGGPKWNDALTEAIHKKASKKTLSPYAFITACTIALACFLLVLNLQPSQTFTPTTSSEQTPNIANITVEEMYVAESDESGEAFNAIKSRLYLKNDYYHRTQETDIVEEIFAAMQPIEPFKPSYFDYFLKKDIIVVDTNENEWRLKLLIYDTNTAYIQNIDSGDMYEFKESESSTLNTLIDSLSADADWYNNFFYPFLVMTVLLCAVHLYFSKKFNIKIYQQVFKNSIIQYVIGLSQAAFIFLLIFNMRAGWISFIPLLIFLAVLYLTIYIWLIYRNATQAYFIRECFTTSILLVFIIYILI